METSAKGRAFIRAHEGDVLTCYLDPAGIPTIGVGFTMRSPAVKRALARLGITELEPGKTKITREQSDAIFTEVLGSADFGGAVRKGVPKNRVVKQHMFDAMVSACYNLGAAFMGWRWIAPWRDRGDVKAAAEIWAHNYNTAGGKKLPGLVRRRREEADLFRFGTYAGVGEGVQRTEQHQKPALPDPVVKEAQEILAKKGFEPGEIDGWFGPKTSAAIKRYQEFHPHLVNDGILGPATLAQLRRDAQALKEAAQKGASAVGGVGALSWVWGLPWGWIAAAVAIAAVGYFAWRYRDVISAKLNKALGKVVEV